MHYKPRIAVAILVVDEDELRVGEQLKKITTYFGKRVSWKIIGKLSLFSGM